MNEQQRGLLYLFERPFEPLNAPRAGGKIIFQKEGEENEELATRFGNATFMTVPANIPNILNEMQVVQQIPKGVPYSQFNPQHRAATKELTQTFMEPQINAILWHVAASIKDQVNEGVFIYSLSYVIIRSPALDSRFLPAIYEVFPNKFIQQDTMQQAIDQLNATPSSEEIVVSQNIDFTGSDLNPEQRLAYWREDYGINSHHWHWHLVFPIEDRRPRDRKGEIFFYMHSEMIARYDWERLSNGLPRVVRLDNWREPIPEGYEHKLTINNSSRNYGGRQPNMTPQNVQRTDNGIRTNIDISDMERRREYVFDAIRQGYMINKKRQREPLSDNVGPGERRGIDILGDAFEADADLSVNPDVYGSIHNEGHDMIAYIHDPNGNQNDVLGVIGDAATAIRDPAFHRWHKFVDDVFQLYKMKQDPYEDKELVFDPVKVESMSVKSNTLDENTLETGWTYRSVDASRGLDFQNEGRPIIVNLQHLTHRPFLYNIQVTNNQTAPLDVTVRLYMAPKFDEAGKAMTFMDQRLLWAEMDRYHTTLEPGLNSLKRLSTESSITIPGELTFRDLEQNTPSVDNAAAAYCGCGWPQHLLLPMGKAEGMDFQIFVLISDWELDKVEGSAGKKTCSNAASFCGILNEKYPDARPMGYPFDRRHNASINNAVISNATDFAQALPNALMTDIKIHFRGSDLNLG